MLPALQKIKQSDRAAEELQTNVDRALGRLLGLNGNPLLDFSRITGVVLAGGSNSIKHKLGRVPRGWIVTDMTGAAVTLFRTSWNASVIVLTSSGTATADFYFF